VDFAFACLSGGARLLQIRAKQLAGRDFLEAAMVIVERARESAALVVVNDRADIARLSGAGGLHVGQDDLTPAHARAVAGAGVLIGLSTHTREQIDAAVLEPIDYLAIGPVFGTASKDTGYEAVGLDRVRLATQIAGTASLPVVAIGGITLDRAQQVLDAGASAVAVISDLLSTGHPEARVRQYLAELRG
jgi:thiamine-phosphate pyrophosphorylase